MQNVAVVDYGLANIRSVLNVLKYLGVEPRLVESGVELEDADKIIVPGVGSFDAGMRGLRERGFVDALNQHVLVRQRPFLGICLGMQFLCQTSAEGEEPGLGWLPVSCRKFPTGPGLPKVPHMGWSDVAPTGDSLLFSSLTPPMTFYFVHSYYLPDVPEACASAICEHGLNFVAAVQKDNIHATQFHPEKSQMAGVKLLHTFLTKA